MTLSAGSRLGPYEILAPIGAGGMGEVYRARDTRLERAVAVKVLPDRLSDSAESRQRFEREAKAISKLSHAHICALYDVGEAVLTESADGREALVAAEDSAARPQTSDVSRPVLYLVMEYLEGETLAERLARKALSLDQTLQFGREIADALAAAHRHGIVHRDLKPGNVMLTRGGVKLLDFGLAKGMEPPTTDPGLTALATAAGSNLTAEGTILGTFQYMAPEQIEGREADARSDIFAFGAVLHEMATGRKAFEGSSQASLISAILRDEPKPISQIQPMSPPALDRLVARCLAKDPEERWQSAQDLASELSWIAGDPRSGAEPAVGKAAPRRSARLPWAIVAASLAVAVALAIVLARRPSPRLPVVRTSILAPENSRFDLLSGPMAVSPDGRRVAFVGRNLEGRSLLFVRPLDSDSPLLLAGTEDASYPFWSPDGRSIGFSTGNSLQIVPAAGGVPEKLIDMIRTRTATWNAQGVIVLSRAGPGNLVQLSLSDRQPRPATTLGSDELVHIAPQFLPDGRHFLYLSRRIDRGSRKLESEIWVGALGSSQRKFILRAQSNAIYATPGFLLFRQDADLVARPFDARSLNITGDPVVLARGIGWADENLTGLFSASETGVLAWAGGGVLGLSQLAICDLAGKRLENVGEPADSWTPRLSHDGRRVAVEIMDRSSGNRDLWVYDLARPSLPVRFTFEPGDEATPVWSPDDSQIAYRSVQRTADPAKPPEQFVAVKSASGAGSETRLVSGTMTGYLTDWSPDGSLLALNHPDLTTRNDVWLVSLRDRTTRIAVQTNAEDRDAVFSPDGRWIAYMSSESGRFEVYVRAFPGPGGPWQISTSGGDQPRWRPDGKALFYLALDGRLMTVPVQAASGFEAQAPQPLFTPRLRRTLIAQYAVFPDGRRLLINSLAAADVADAIHVVQNWTAMGK